MDRNKKAREEIKKKTIVLWGPPANKSTGNGKLIYHMAKAFHQEGHKVFTIGNEYNDVQIVYEGWLPILPGFFCEFCGNAHKGDSFMVQKIANYLNSFQPDYFIAIGDPFIMHQFGLGNLNFSKIKTKALAYATIDSEGMFCNDNLLQQELPDYLDRCDKVISTSKYTQEQFKEWLDLDTEMIHETIDLKNYSPITLDKKIELRKKHRFKDDDFIMYYSGRNIMRKRHHTLIEAAAELINETENTYLYLNIPPTKEVEGTPLFVDNLNPIDFVGRVLKKKYGRDFLKEGRIVFISRQGLGQGLNEQQNAELYQLSDVYVCSTAGEGFGLCCHPDTKILTGYGTAPISEISKDEYVFTHRGRLKKVKEVMKREVNEDLICFKPEKLRQEIKITKEHPIWVANRDGNGYFKEARLLKEGDTILYPLKIFNQIDSIKKTLDNGTAKIKVQKNTCNYLPLTIKEVWKEKYTGLVYNLEIEDDESYLTESVALHNCPIESMACSVPVIVPDNSTGPETVGVNEDGEGIGGIITETPIEVWVDFNLKQHLTTTHHTYVALKKLYDAPELRERLGVQGREYTEKKFGFELFKKKWLKVIRKTEKKVSKVSKEFKQIEIKNENKTEEKEK